MIIHADEEEPLGRRRRPGIASGPATEKGRHTCRFPPSPADLDQCADNGPDHVTEEAVPRDFIRQQPPGVTPLGSGHRSNGSPHGATRALKRGEIVSANQSRRGPRHGVHVEWFVKVPDERPIKGIGDLRVPDPVLVGLRPGAEPRVKVRLDVLDRQHPNVFRKLGVEGTPECDNVVTEFDGDTCHLTEGVDAGIGATSAVHGYPAAFKSSERVLEHTLDRLALGLPLPSDEPRSVVGKRQLEGSHT